MSAVELSAYLGGNPYPGRGIFLGRSADDKNAVIAYFIMGRSQNSRNRVFVTTEDGIRTQAHDPSKMEDPSLIIYHPVRVYEGTTIVTNGDQTDTIRDHMAAGHCYRHGLHTRTFEPDGPNYTPSISGEVESDGKYAQTILKRLDGGPDCCCRYFYEYDAPQPGTGHIIHTYMGDGSPLPSFRGEPVMAVLTAPDAQSLAEEIWGALNEENKVSLFVQYIDLATGERDTVIVNKNQ